MKAPPISTRAATMMAIITGGLISMTRISFSSGATGTDAAGGPVVRGGDGRDRPRCTKAGAPRAAGSRTTAPRESLPVRLGDHARGARSRLVVRIAPHVDRSQRREDLEGLRVGVREEPVRSM